MSHDSAKFATGPNKSVTFFVVTLCFPVSMSQLSGVPVDLLAYGSFDSQDDDLLDPLSFSVLRDCEGDSQPSDHISSASLELPRVPGSPIPSDNFRLQSQRFMLTYSSHLDKKEYVDWFNCKLGFAPKFIRLAHENGSENYPHTHVLVHLGCHRWSGTRNARYFDYNGIHPHVRKYHTMAAFERAQEYIGKEDQENSDLRHPVSFVDAILSAPSDVEALRCNAQSLRDVTGVLAVRSLVSRQLPLNDVILPNRPFQQAILEYVTGRVHPREILWIYDPAGNSGKTVLSNYLEDEMGFFAIAGVANVRELACQIQTAITGGLWEGRGIIYDVARGFEHSVGLYHCLEVLKNGRMTSTKYKGGRLRFASPHVIVFSNFWPHVEHLTSDRWNIQEVVHPQLVLERRGLHYREPNPVRHCSSCTCQMTVHGFVTEREKQN